MDVLTKRFTFLLFSIFFSLLITSCEKDENKDQYEYIDNSFISGTWINTFAKDSCIYILEKDEENIQIQFYTEKDGKQKHIETKNYGKYKLTKNKILLQNNGDIWSYEIVSKDSIVISQGLMDINCKRLLPKEK